MAGLHRKAFRAYLLEGESKASSKPEYREYQQSLNGKHYMPSFEGKAYQADNPAGGGFAVPPMEMVSEFLTLMKDLMWIRQFGTIFSVPTAEGLGVPAIDTDPSDSDWTTELGTGSEETTAAIGKRELRPHPVAKRIKLSKKLLRQVPNFDTVILDRLAYKAGITEEKAFLTGSGANQPLGLFIASTNGISTARDTTAAGASAIAGDDLINVWGSLKPQYRAKAVWVINRTVLTAIRKLKDSAGAYLWQPGNSMRFVAQGTSLVGDTPETILGRPVYESEYAPGTITTGLYTALFGDLSRYWIADALDMQIQVLDQLYAETNQNGYILRKETDGMPVLEEAFARLKQA
jgi:HK97 family phage major capsid protein